MRSNQARDDFLGLWLPYHTIFPENRRYSQTGGKCACFLAWGPTEASGPIPAGRCDPDFALCRAINPVRSLSPWRARPRLPSATPCHRSFRPSPAHRYFRPRASERNVRTALPAGFRLDGRCLPIAGCGYAIQLRRSLARPKVRVSRGRKQPRQGHLPRGQIRPAEEIRRQENPVRRRARSTSRDEMAVLR